MSQQSKHKDYLDMSAKERAYADTTHETKRTREQRPVLINELQQIGAERLLELRGRLKTEISHMNNEIEALDAHALAVEVHDLKATHAKLSSHLSNLKKE